MMSGEEGARKPSPRTALIAPDEMMKAAGASFQMRVGAWMRACFGETVSLDRVERNHRFLEESLELVQACGCTAEDAHKLVDYVFSRPVGDPPQEVGGVMVTLAALVNANSLYLASAAENELARVWTKVDAIRAKQATKPHRSPLPGTATTTDDGCPEFGVPSFPMMG